MKNPIRSVHSIFVLLLVLLVPALGFGQNARPKLALQPPMGWNSWDAYGLDISEQQFRDNVKVQAARLLPFGYRYAVIDEGWFMENPSDRPTPEKLRYKVDPFGRFEPVTSRYPSVASNPDAKETNFMALGSYVHSLGLQFGIHIVKGIPRVSTTANLPIEGSAFTAKDAADTGEACSWDPTTWGVLDNAAGQAWYDSLLRQYAGWGVDYLKVDCIASRPYRPSEIQMIRKAIAKTGRPILLSLSPGPAPLEFAAEFGNSSEMWRISHDIWDFWHTETAFPQGIHEQFSLAASWASYAKPGNWPDADMLPFGWLGPTPGYGSARFTQLTLDEERTQFTLWAMMRSPLVLGANLTRLDPATFDLITNRTLLDIDQRSHDGKQVMQKGDLVTWTSRGSHGQTYIAFFNTGEGPLPLDVSLAAWVPASAASTIRDVWHARRMPSGTSRAVAPLAPHACLLLEVVPAGTKNRSMAKR